MADEREQLPSRDEVRTAVAADFCDEILASLDRPAKPNDALVRAVERARRHLAR